MAESSRSRSRIRSRSRCRERARCERAPCAGPPFRGTSEDPDTIVLDDPKHKVKVKEDERDRDFHLGFKSDRIILCDPSFIDKKGLAEARAEQLRRKEELRQRLYKEERVVSRGDAPHQQQLPFHLRTNTPWHLMASKMVPKSDA